MIDNFTKVYKEKGKITSVFRYSQVGYGIDLQPIFAEFETEFSIAKGVIQDDKFTRYVDRDGNTYTSAIRA